MNEKNSKRKFLATTLGALIVVNALALCGYSVVKLGNSSANLNSELVTTNIDELDSETKEGIKEEIRYAIENGINAQEGFDKFNVSTSIIMDYVLPEFLAENPQYFYVTSDRCKVTYPTGFYDDTGIKKARVFKVEYPENYQEQIEFIEKTANEIVAGIDDSMNDYDKALYVHDYLAINFSYDTRIFSDDENVRGQAARSLYDFFQQKTGVCQAYTAAYQYIMQYKLGIPTRNVFSYDMGHTWNVIQIDGQWYHVDVTWDDTTPDRAGCVLHKNFLVSDSDISATNHFNWNFTRGQEVSCTDTRFDAHWWKNISAEIFRINGAWYSVDANGNFIARTTMGEPVDSVPSLNLESEQWFVWNSDFSVWEGNYTTLLKYGDVFIYNDTKNVYAINLDGSDKRLIASYPKEDYNGFQIFGMGINENNELYVNLQNNPQDMDGVPMEINQVIVGNLSDIIGSAQPVSSNGGSQNFTDWEQVSTALEENQSVEVNFEEQTEESTPIELPASVVESVKGKDVDLVINIGSYQWTVNGLNVSDDAEVADVNLGVKENSGLVPEDVTNKYVDEQKTVEVNLEHEGQFGYTANLKYYVGTEFAGQMASVLHYETDNERLAYQETVIVDENGYAVFNFCHASSYMVVLDNKAVGLPGDIDNDGNATIVDYVRFKQYLVGEAEADASMKLVNVDIDGDNEINIRDALLLAKELIK